MEITCLGSGDAFSYHRNRNCFLINGKVLLDCPPEILRGIYGAGKDPSSIETVFLSHLHADHYFGLPFLFLEYLFKNPKEELQIIGPENTERSVKKNWKLAYPEIDFLDEEIMINYKEVEPGKQYSSGNLSFEPYKMKHADGLMTLGYRINFEGGKTIAYTGDTTYTEAIFELARDADLLIMDCSYPKDSSDYHLGFEKVKEIGERLPRTTKMIITHLSEVTKEMREEEGIMPAEGSKTYKI